MKRVFDASEAKGGCDPEPAKTAVVFIEFQNEFTTEGGKLHDAVKAVMAETGMLAKAADLAAKARKAGVTIIHAPITFKASYIVLGCMETYTHITI